MQNSLIEAIEASQKFPNYKDCLVETFVEAGDMVNYNGIICLQCFNSSAFQIQYSKYVTNFPTS